MTRKRKHHPAVQHADEATNTDQTTTDEEPAAEVTNDSIFGIPGTVNSDEYIDLELARINPPV